ncbi:hypothetical protein COM24_06870 [Bacillus toyonensis]|uniref:hypothetical protein n=1 Tax=Bacillus toyonensis TaxID=155322 RepID=UPI000BF4859E|nr:hypothetical protein [Bacillus toyonensis]PGC56530.1 hypothetical protein COM24_06870 [Bacillus toyonensis]
MALFGGVTGPLQDTPDQKFRTNTKLQAGTHDSPGEKFLVDPRLPRLFRYHFGGDGWVVIPKGRVVAPATNGGKDDDGRFDDFDANVPYNAITLANGGKDVEETGRDGERYTRSANIPIGVAYANLYEEFVDGFNGMQPTVENEIYIELPYISNKEDAYELQWGCFYDTDITRPVKAGDFVMADEQGYVIKADFEKIRTDIDGAADLPALKGILKEQSRMQEQVFGQVWAVETNLPPQGWLKWVGWADEDMKNDDWKTASGARTSDIGSQDGFPGYPYEKSYRNWDTRSNKYYPQGIPGLTNGSNIEVPFKDEVIGQVNVGVSGRHDFFLLHTPAVEGTVEIKVGGEVVKPEYVDATSGRVVFSFDNSKGTTPKDVTATYKATGQLPGVPTGWDFKGSIGAIRIILQK